MTKRKQDELTRRRRIKMGCCPTHGIAVVQTGVAFDNGQPTAAEVECPRKDCDFKGRSSAQGAEIYEWSGGELDEGSS